MRCDWTSVALLGVALAAAMAVAACGGSTEQTAPAQPGASDTLPDARPADAEPPTEDRDGEEADLSADGESMADDVATGDAPTDVAHESDGVDADGTESIDSGRLDETGIPSTITTYFIGGFDRAGVDAVLAEPDPAGGLMVAGFDLWRDFRALDEGGYAYEIDDSLIEAAHGAGIELWVDLSAGWAPEPFWSDEDALRSFVLRLAEAGVDGVDFDEFGDALDADWLRALLEELSEHHPSFRVIVTEVWPGSVRALLRDGAQPHAVALAWYLAGEEGFEACLNLRELYGVACAYWVDPSTWEQVPRLRAQADAVLSWNLCWRASTCGARWPEGTWAPWESARRALGAD